MKQNRTSQHSALVISTSLPFTGEYSPEKHRRSRLVLFRVVTLIDLLGGAVPVLVVGARRAPTGPFRGHAVVWSSLWYRPFFTMTRPYGFSSKVVFRHLPNIFRHWCGPFAPLRDLHRATERVEAPFGSEESEESFGPCGVESTKSLRCLLWESNLKSSVGFRLSGLFSHFLHSVRSVRTLPAFY